MNVMTDKHTEDRWYHPYILSATDEELAAANEAADWLMDAVATVLQDRKFLRGGPEYDPIVGNTIIMCGIVACLRAISGLKHVE
jgi:hypothetical protein